MSRDAGPDAIGTTNGPLPTEDARSLAGVPDGFGRFWTPYRMAYIRGEGKPSDASDVGCPFCTAPGKDDQTGLIVHRGRTCFVLMNLFPYNSGHLLVCPYRHVSNFLPIIAQTKAVPELLEDARARLAAAWPKEN